MITAGLRPTRGSSSAERGTSLLEIVITMAIMTIGLLGFFTLHIRSSQTSASAATMTQAASLAGALQDTLQAIPLLPGAADARPDALKTSPVVTNDKLQTFYYDLGKVTVAGTTTSGQARVFYRSYQVEDSTTVPDLSANQIRISVRVKYPSEDGRCPSCAVEADRQGWKAVTTTTLRTATAY